MTAPMRVDGADLSHHNPDPDLVRAKANGLKFLYHKSTEGGTVSDRTYNARRAAAKAAGVPFGAYHFARPDSDSRDAALEARYFIKIANPKVGDLCPVLDFEVSHHSAEKWSKEFMAEVSRLLKERGLEGRPVHYGPDDFGSDYPYLRWVPRYNNQNEPPRVPTDIWQFSNGQQGVPNSFPGLGRVDLNTLRGKTKVSDFRLRKIKTPKPSKRQVGVLRQAHFSMQFSDSTAQKRADVLTIFGFAKKKQLHWFTGTEAGAGSYDLRDLLMKNAPKYGYRFWSDKSTDTWFCVRESFIKGGWKTHVGVTVVPGKAGQNTAKKLTAVSWDTDTFGRINVLAAHYLTRGRPSAKDPAYRQRIDENRRISKEIGDYSKKVGKGSALVFYSGDQNIEDRVDDTFFGQPLTSCWDELKKWPKTHPAGTIDVTASYDADARVSCKRAYVITDKVLKLHTDHSGVFSAYNVVKLKTA